MDATDNKRPLTDRQKDILRAICEYQLTHRFSPTLREIARGAGVALNAISQHVAAIEKKGWIRRQPRRARTISVVGGPAAVLAEIGPDVEKLCPAHNQEA